MGKKVVKYLIVAAVVVVLIIISVLVYKVVEQKIEIERLKRFVKNLEDEREILKLYVEDTFMNYTSVKVGFINREGYVSGGMKRYVLPGDMVYIESIVLQFSYPLIERGKKSVAFPVKIYSSKIKPESGYPLIPVDREGLPLSYSVKSLDRKLKVYNRILKKLWFYANNPHRIPKKYGISRIYGQAVFIKARKDKIYKVIVKSTGDMAIEVE